MILFPAFILHYINATHQHSYIKLLTFSILPHSPHISFNQAYPVITSTMKVLYLSALLSTAVATPLPSSAAAGGLKLGKVIYGGSGCPQGSLSLKFSEDGKTVPIDYGKGMNSAIGPGISVEESRKNCQINVELFFQPGFQYSVYSADYTGYANLESGVQGEIKSSYYFSGDAKQVGPTF